MSYAQAQVRDYALTMRITPHIFDAFLKRATKGHLRSLSEVGSGNSNDRTLRGLVARPPSSLFLFFGASQQAGEVPIAPARVR
jgi:hypothetical protein